MSHVVVSNLAYAHPGRRPAVLRGLVQDHARASTSGSSAPTASASRTLFRVLAGQLPADDGDVDIGTFAYMPQDVGVGPDSGRTVRELLLEAAPARLRDAGERMIAAERELAAGADPAGAGMRLGEAIGDWSELGGYELEGQWDAACRRIVRAPLDDVGARATTQLSGGERKQLVLEVLFASDAAVLLLDEPDNFLDVPAKLELEARIAASKKTVVLISHDRDLLAAATNAILTLEANGTWIARRLVPRPTRRRARSASSCSATGSSSGSARSAACSSSTRS